MVEDKVPDPTVIPLVEEIVEVEKNLKTGGGVLVRTSTVSEERLVDEPFLREDVTVRRVPVSRFVDRVEADRIDGETEVIALHREVLQVVRRLQVYEELHITRRRYTDRHRETITLRRQTASVERIEGPEDN